jgi:hypothetical protein
MTVFIFEVKFGQPPYHANDFYSDIFKNKFAFT